MTRRDRAALSHWFPQIEAAGIPARGPSIATIPTRDREVNSGSGAGPRPRVLFAGHDVGLAAVGEPYRVGVV